MQTEETNKSISERTEKRIKLISTIIMVIIIIIGLLVTTDIILVKKANIGPFSPLKLKSITMVVPKNTMAFSIK